MFNSFVYLSHSIHGLIFENVSFLSLSKTFCVLQVSYKWGNHKKVVLVRFQFKFG